MIAEPTTTSAAPSTSAAPAPASQAPAPQEADTGNLLGLTDADIASALAELDPEARTAEPAPAEPAPDSDPAPAPAATEPEAPAADEDPDAAPAASADAAAPTGEAAPSAEPPPSDPAAEKKAVPEGFQRRIDELTAARRTAEERVAQLEQQVSALTARDAGRYEPDVLEAVEDPATLEKQRSQWQSLHTWAARHLNAPEAKLPGTDKTMTPEEVANLFASTSTLLNEAAPRRAAFLQERARLDAATNQVYPWASDIKDGLGAALHQGLKELPELRRLPNGRVIAADALIGQALRNTGVRVDDALLKRLAAEAKRAPAPAAGTPRPGTAATQPPRRQPVPPAAPARPGTVPARPTSSAQAQAAHRRVSRGDGSEEALAASIAHLIS